MPHLQSVQPNFLKRTLITMAQSMLSRHFDVVPDHLLAFSAIPQKINAQEVQVIPITK
jgi:hypothetical protein